MSRKTASIGAAHSRMGCDTYISTMEGGAARVSPGGSLGRECSLLPASEAKRTPATLIALADRLRRLGPSRRDPERFHIDKSEIEAELRLLARRITHG